MSLAQSTAFTRVEALKARHVALEEQIREIEKHASADPQEVRALKRAKLGIKDELASLH